MRKSIVIFAAINAACLFLVVRTDLYIINLARMEERVEYDGVDGISFCCIAGPILLGCFIFNVSWGIMAIWKAFRRDFMPLLALAIATVIWGGAFEITRWISITTLEKTRRQLPHISLPEKPEEVSTGSVQ